MESELFGYKRGSFTGAVADKRGLMEAATGGTLLLDEIAEMPVHLQTKLLRVLQQRKLRRLADFSLFAFRDIEGNAADVTLAGGHLHREFENPPITLNTIRIGNGFI